jgi:hypothetical protein
MGLLSGPQQAQRFGLLSPDVMSLIQNGLSLPPPAAPAPARRERVSGWRVFDRVLGGQTVTEGLDAERARLQAEANAPQEAMMMAREAQIAQEMGGGPAWLALRGNRGELASNVGKQFAPQTLANGSMSVTPGMVNQSPILNERREMYGQHVVGMGGPGQDPGVRMSAPASFSDQNDAEKTRIAEFNALNPVLPPNSTWAGPVGGGRTGLVPQAPVSLPQGGSVAPFDPVTGEFGAPTQGNPDTPTNGGRNGQQYDATTRGALQAASNTANLARQRATDARRFIELNRANPTGTGAAMMGPLAGLNPAFAEMRAISARLIPAERTPGSGPMSDGDAVLYGRAVLDVDKPGPTNQALADVVIAGAERDADYASFLDEYAIRNGNLVGANEDWQAYVNANPLFASGPNGQTVRRPARQIQPWRDFMGFGERQRGGSQSRAGGGQSAPASAGRATHRNAQGQGIYWNGSAWVPGQ